MSSLVNVAERAGLDLSHLPKHVAIIMDGNGRWATGKGLGRLLGHREGYQTLKGVVEAAGELGIGYLTVYAFSAENWRRPEAEVAGLMKLIEGAMREQTAHLVKKNVRVHIIGRLNELPDSLREALEQGVSATAHCTGLTFCLAINYGGRAEIVDAVRAMIAQGTAPGSVTEELVSANLYRPDYPEPDLMVRTAGEMRWSNFLIWQAAYAELVVTKTSWPEFTGKSLVDALVEYQRRTRKFGGLS